jgi:hypothetical protein
MGISKKRYTGHSIAPCTQNKRVATISYPNKISVQTKRILNQKRLRHAMRMEMQEKRAQGRQGSPTNADKTTTTTYVSTTLCGEGAWIVIMQRE